MPSEAKISRHRAWQSSGMVLMARILGYDSDPIEQADLTGISYSVFTDAGVAVVDATALVVSNVLFDTLQTDSRWTKDSTGYNFVHTLPASALATGQTLYRVEYIFDPVSGDDFPAVFEIHTQPILTE